MSQVKKQFSFINYARLIAILLITNSHFDVVYPWPVSFGGAPGVALFFMISGFLLTKKPENYEPIEHWYGRRLKRMYPSIWIATTLLIIVKYYTVDGLTRFLELFVYPTGFWFIAAILELYLLFYLVTKAKVSYKTVVLFEIALYVLSYIKGYESKFFVEASLRVTAGFIAMLIGAEWKQRTIRNESTVGFNKNRTNLLVSLFSLAGFLSIKILLSKNILFELQFLTHLFSIVFAYYLLIFMLNLESRFEKLDTTIIGKFLNLVSACSLEIYMIQRWIIDCLKDYMFPVNFILIWSVVIFGGIIIQSMSSKLVSVVDEILNRGRN